MLRIVRPFQCDVRWFTLPLKSRIHAVLARARKEQCERGAKIEDHDFAVIALWTKNLEVMHER